MKFLQKLLCCKTRRRNEEAVDPLERLSKDVEKERVTKTGKQPQGMPKWVEMKCNSLVYLKQLMKNNRKKKLLLVKQEKDQKKDQNKEKEENKETDKKEVAEIIENDSNQQEVLKSQTNESMSMMCPICHFFMYKSVCATCGHMFCQYCLDEYLIFKDSCPVCEKSIRKGKITRC